MNVQGQDRGVRRWDDVSWNEKSDNAWQKRLRRHQAWWRETVAQLPAGASARGDRDVVSMLPADVGLRPNLMTDEAATAANRTLARLAERKGPGLVQLDRLQRNLLSSQPLCFNLFGHLSARPQALLPWVRSIDPLAAEVTGIDLEVAPTDRPLGGSAFDAYVVYRRSTGRTGFLGIECKYAEDLVQSQRDPASCKYVKETVPPRWRADATKALDTHGLRQLWYNTLLVQRVLDTTDHEVGRSLVVAMAADDKARAATAEVAAQLTETDSLVFVPLEDVVAAVTGEDAWKQAFVDRYLDLALSGS